MSGKMKVNLIVISVVWCSVVSFGECPSTDFSGDCFVDIEDFTVMAGQWLDGYDWHDLISLAASQRPAIAVVGEGNRLRGVIRKETILSSMAQDEEGGVQEEAEGKVKGGRT